MGTSTPEFYNLERKHSEYRKIKQISHKVTQVEFNGVMYASKRIYGKIDYEKNQALIHPFILSVNEVH